MTSEAVRPRRVYKQNWFLMKVSGGGNEYLPGVILEKTHGDHLGKFTERLIKLEIACAVF